MTILWLGLLPRILYCWQSTLQMDWLKRRWSKCRERKSYCCLFTKVKFRNFTLSFGRLRQRLEVKCVPHVQHDYFSPFNQSDHCFLVSPMPLPSSLQKFPSVLIWLRKPSSIKLFSWYVWFLNTVEPRLSGPRLSGLFDYPDFFSGPVFFMNINKLWSQKLSEVKIF